jgi:hypothetical protein
MKFEKSNWQPKKNQAKKLKKQKKLIENSSKATKASGAIF